MRTIAASFTGVLAMGIELRAGKAQPCPPAHEGADCLKDPRGKREIHRGRVPQRGAGHQGEEGGASRKTREPGEPRIRQSKGDGQHEPDQIRYRERTSSALGHALMVEEPARHDGHERVTCHAGALRTIVRESVPKS